MSPAAEQRIIELPTWAVNRLDMRLENEQKGNIESAEQHEDSTKMYEYFTGPLEDLPSHPSILPGNKKIRKP